jgi:G3E family GTPase
LCLSLLSFFVDEDVRAMYTLDGIITVVDAKHIITRLDDEKPEGVENEAVEQVAFADRILLNKTDLVEETELAPIEERLKTINPTVKIFRCEKSKVDPLHLIGIKAFSLDKTLEMDPEFLNTDAEHEHDPSVSSCGIKFEGFLNVRQLYMWIDEIIQTMGANLFRYKGVLSVAGKKEKFVFQGVGMLFSGDFVAAQWAEGEPRECRFVFIGKNLDKKALIDGFNACKCSEELRFKVGDKVLARVGQRDYKSGVVLALWDDGNAYRVELQDDEKTNVWGPIDKDTFIKAAAKTTVTRPE